MLLGVGGHLRLFKQINEEYQSLKPLREMLLVCSPAAEAFVSPRETILSFVNGGKEKKRDIFKITREKAPAPLLKASKHFGNLRQSRVAGI